MAGMNGYEACCGNCKFWKRVDIGRADGFCRRRPPKLLVMLAPHPTSVNQMIQVADTKFPKLPDTEWCGKHRSELKVAAIDLTALKFQDEGADPA